MFKIKEIKQRFSLTQTSQDAASTSGCGRSEWDEMTMRALWIKKKRHLSIYREWMKHALLFQLHKWREDLDSKRNRECFYHEPWVCSKYISLCSVMESRTRFEPPWINKFHTRKHLILSLREHLILLPVVSNLITTASKITPKANQAGRNHTNTWVTEEQNGLVSQHCFHWDPHYTAYIRNN